MFHFNRLLAAAVLGAIALGAASPALAAKAPAKAPAKFDAKAYFASNCAGCHGAKGEGTMAPNLQKVEAKGDKFIAHRITNGSPEKGMPPFAQLSAAELKALTAYVKTL